MNRRDVIAVVSLGSFASAQTKPSSVREKLLGTWDLISWEAKLKTTGKVEYPCGKTPVGRITYDSAGRMSAQLMDPGRPVVGKGLGTRAMFDAFSASDMREVLAGCFSYFGTFEIDEPARTVIHHVQADLRPAWFGIERRRTYEFSGDNQFILTSSTDESDDRLIWKRDIA
jgi:hypothetical protein